MNEPSRTALVLSGGGARAAYQVGVLKTLAALRREAIGEDDSRVNPFGIIVGTSAGAINSAALACHADDFNDAVARITEVWANFRAEDVYRADMLGVARNGAQWLTMLSIGWALARWRRFRPRSLLDNSPLIGLLQRVVPMERLPTMLAHRHVHALAVTASSYSTGEHVTFYNSTQPIEPWVRSQRLAVPTALSHEHLLASAAIPFVFPAQRLFSEGRSAWYGDGTMRQTAPLSPAIHLGAQRMMVIGAGRMHEPAAQRLADRRYPSLAQIAGHAMSSIFLDAMAVDIERLARINRTLSLLPAQALENTPLRPVECLVIAPSQRLDDIAARHLDALPGPVRTLLHGAGVSKAGPQAQGSALASYLLFEASYTHALMALGEADTLARREEVARFFGWPRQALAQPIV